MLLTECEVRTGGYCTVECRTKELDRAVSSSTDRTNSVNKLFIICQKINKTRLQQFYNMNKAGKRLMINIRTAEEQLFVFVVA